MSPTPKSFPKTVAVYRWLLRLYPPAFRREYEAEIVQVFDTCCRARYTKGQRWGLLAFYWRTLLDLFVTAGVEWWCTWTRRHEQERSPLMLQPVDQHRPFMEEVTSVMDRQPDYYQLFVTQIESLHSVGAVADCLMLDGDLSDPHALFAFFQETGTSAQESGTPRWLARLCAAVRQSLHDASPGPASNITHQLIQRIYANPALFELIAAEEVGQQLVEVVESLALDGNSEQIDEMLALMQQWAN